MFFPSPENILLRRITMKAFSTFLAISVFVAATLVAGCATTATVPGATAFTGEVWTWDEQENWVTLRQAGRDVRVLVTPDQLIGLQLHSTRTIYGTLAPPMSLPLILVEGPSCVVPNGPADEMQVAGTVAVVDPAGKLVVNTPQGAVQIWRATNGVAFTQGGNVRVHMRVQPMNVVLIQPGPGGATSPAPTPLSPSASPRTEVGDYAIVMGRVVAVDPAGAITVESSRGPVTVRVPTASRYKVNDTVEVRTSVHPA
jgi:predicted small secreted protein